MSEICRDFRNEWLEQRERGEQAVLFLALTTHAESCVECQAWVRSTRAQIRLMSGLERRTAPAALASNLERELAGRRTHRVERLLGSLVRLAAPAELDERVLGIPTADGLAGADEERGRKNARALRTLDVHPAPHVLDRLVDEELNAPDRHLAERFSGNLERLRAPQTLEQLLHIRVRRRALVKLFAVPLATLVAAGVIVWFALQSDEESRSEYSFQVVRASGLEGLDPLARSLAETLSGGVSSASLKAEERGG